MCALTPNPFFHMKHVSSIGINTLMRMRADCVMVIDIMSEPEMTSCVTEKKTDPFSWVKYSFSDKIFNE